MLLASSYPISGLVLSGVFLCAVATVPDAWGEGKAVDEVVIHGSNLPDNGLPGTVNKIAMGAIDLAAADRPEDAFKLAGIGSGSSNMAGLGTGINLRGFDVGSRLFINQHPDIQRLYVRDLATVEQAEILKGHSSALYGQAAPGGTINYALRQPSKVTQSELRYTLDNYGLNRLVLDHNQPLGDSAIRLIYAGQTGHTFIQNLDNRRQSVLLSGQHDYASGAIRVELEYQRNERPYAFGTVFAGGRFHYDQYYLAAQSQALREYARQAVYWDQQLGKGWTLNGLFNASQVERHETLAGFWTLKSSTSLSSYYRKLVDEVNQSNLRLELKGSHTLGGMKNEMRIGYQQDQQYIDFSGPQNIGGFSLDIEHPDFNQAWEALPLSPRVSHERYDEAGLFFLNQLQATERVRLIAGVRNSALKIQTDNGIKNTVPADIHHLSSVAGIKWQPLATLGLHLMRSESFEPNRGTTRDGGFLLPRQGRQWEAGIGMEGAQLAGKLALFDLTQSNLTATDPLDKNALVTIGTIQVQGLETSLAWDYADIVVRANMGWQRARNQRKTSAALGDKIANVPAVFGAIRLNWRARADWEFWGGVSAVGQRAGDPANSFSAPGYATLDVGAQYRLDRKTTLALGIGNLADRRYIEALSAADNVYQGERRRVTVSVRRLL